MNALKSTDSRPKTLFNCALMTQLFGNHKFTNDDDECVIDIDGWEVIWRLGDDWMEGMTSLDVHFSRKEMKAIICAFDDST